MRDGITHRVRPVAADDGTGRAPLPPNGARDGRKRHGGISGDYMRAGATLVLTVAYLPLLGAQVSTTTSTSVAAAQSASNPWGWLSPGR